MTATDSMTNAREAAHAAYINASLDGADREACLDASLDAFTATLTAAGLLTPPGRAPGPQELDQAAQWLALQASRAGFHRYDGEEWRLLRTSTVHIEVATNKALAAIMPGENDRAFALTAACRLLTEHVSDANLGR